MIQPQALGALANAHELLLQLLESLPPRDCNRRFDAELPSAGWLLGRAVFLELHLLRSLVMKDDDLAARVRHLFSAAQPVSAEIDAQLPPRDHLLSWASQIFDEHLTWLANPGQLLDHPLLDDGWLVWHLAQRQSLIYERLVAVITARSAQRQRGGYRVDAVLEAHRPRNDSTRIEQGHYRIGARDGVAMAQEQPAQAVELHAFRICRHPVSNAEYLAFIEQGGYRVSDWWDADGRQWLISNAAQAPWHWRRDDAGHWYAIGTTGPVDLHPDEPVAGLCAHEARAFASWAAAHGEGLSGAVPQHEYQWEVAARLDRIERRGRVWEWCANAFHHYPGYQPPPDPTLESCVADQGQTTLRGGCLHTQKVLRRPSVRSCASPTERTLFAGTRLVIPAGKAAWE